MIANTFGCKCFGFSIRYKICITIVNYYLSFGLYDRAGMGQTSFFDSTENGDIKPSRYGVSLLDE